MGNRDRRGYQTDVTDEEWSFVAPYLALCREDARQRDYPLREMFNAMRYVAKTGCHWRMLPNDLPPWTVVYQQMRRWIDARCFETDLLPKISTTANCGSLVIWTGGNGYEEEPIYGRTDHRGIEAA